MTPLEVRNLLTYCGIAAGLILTSSLAGALASQTLPGFRTGEMFAPGAPTLATLCAVLGPILGVYFAALRPRAGSAELAADVDEARKRTGRRRAALKVVPVATPADPLPPEHVDQLVDAVERRMKAKP